MVFAYRWPCYVYRCPQTLRKGATDQEKEEFLKEAVLMSNFIEEHILRLLGVCLDNDPQFIILELMEGGDLLTYLRASRPTPVSFREDGDIIFLNGFFLFPICTRKNVEKIL